MALVGFKIFQLTTAAPSAVSISGAVSPITRETASKIPVKIPPDPDGKVTLKITLVNEAPKPIRILSTSGEAFSKFLPSRRTTIGNIMMVAPLPANARITSQRFFYPYIRNNANYNQKAFPAINR